MHLPVIKMDWQHAATERELPESNGAFSPRFVAGPL
jgi:hypothetical protein